MLVLALQNAKTLGPYLLKPNLPFTRGSLSPLILKEQITGFYYFVIAPLYPNEHTFLLEMSHHGEKSHCEICCSNRRWSFQNKPICFSQ